MNIKDYYKSRKITPQQMKNLCLAVLQQTPDDLTEEQVNQLDASLAQAAEQAALPPGEESRKEAGDIVAAEAAHLQETQQVIDIIGQDALKRHMVIYLTHHIQNLQKLSLTRDEIFHRFEQETYNKAGETIARMTRNMDAAFSGALSDAERIMNRQTPDDEKLYQEYLGLVDEFLTGDKK